MTLAAQTTIILVKLFHCVIHPLQIFGEKNALHYHQPKSQHARIDNLLNNKACQSYHRERSLVTGMTLLITA